MQHKPPTACWSQGKNQKYPYYLCPSKGCESYRKSIRREALEEEFEGILQRLEQSENLFALVKAMFRDAWDMRLQQAAQAASAMKASIRGIEKQIGQLLDRIVDATNESVVAAYEKRIARLERQKALALEKLSQTGKPLHTFEKSFEHAMRFLQVLGNFRIALTLPEENGPEAGICGASALLPESGTSNT